MKTAEVLYNDFPYADIDNHRMDTMEYIKQIQLDAMKFCKSQIIIDGNPECAIEKIDKKIQELTN